MNRYSRPSRPTWGNVSASTPVCTSVRAGSSGEDAARSAIQTSLRGAVPGEAVSVSHRPSRLTDTPKYSVLSRPSPKTSVSESGEAPTRCR